MTRVDRLILAIPGTLILVLILYAFLVPPPVEFHSRTIQPEQASVCPGDTLRWSVGFTIHRAPVVIAIVRSWWNVDRQQTMKPDTSPDWTAYLEEVSVEGAPRSAVVPDGLPPGRYELQTGVQALRSSQPDVYVVEFEIPEGCDE